jgi:hypothetical protein
LKEGLAATEAEHKKEEIETRFKQKMDEGNSAEGKADAAKGDIIQTNIAHDSDLHAKDPGTTLTAASAVAIFVARYTKHYWQYPTITVMVRALTVNAH